MIWLSWLEAHLAAYRDAWTALYRCKNSSIRLLLVRCKTGGRSEARSRTGKNERGRICVKNIEKFEKPLYVTQPIMPDFQVYTERLKEIWDSKWLSNQGEQHKKLEAQLLDYLDAPYLTLFNNGTTALTVAIQGLRLQGEVITTPFSFPATTHALACSRPHMQIPHHHSISYTNFLIIQCEPNSNVRAKENITFKF